MSDPMGGFRFDPEWRISLLTAILLPFLVLLGFWQLQRAEEKATLATTWELRRHQSPATLSAGEQQRVGIARAIVSRPKLLIADEPTGNLDPDLSLEVMRIFRRFNEVGVTLLIASHDIALIDKLGCRRIELDGGKLARAVEDPDPWE